MTPEEQMKISECVRQICKAAGSLVEETEKLLALSIGGGHCMDFYQRYLSLCIDKGESPTAAAKAIGLSNAAPSGWKKGAVPNDSTIVKLSKHFGVPSWYLIAGTQEKELAEAIKKVFEEQAGK